MKETIERLRRVHAEITEVVGEVIGHRHAAALEVAAEDIQTSIIELERVQAQAEAIAPAFMSVQNAVRRAFEVQVEASARKARCTCGVGVSHSLKGREGAPVLTDPQCPIHGGIADV